MQQLLFRGLSTRIKAKVNLSFQRSMGHSKFGGLLSGVLLLSLSTPSWADSAKSPILTDLEAGSVVASKAGSSFVVQEIINSDPVKVAKTFADPSQIGNLFDNIAFSRAYLATDTKGEVHKVLYLKLRGLGDGLGILVEVKQGGDEAFATARALTLSAESFRPADVTQDADVSKDVQTKELMSAAMAENKLGQEVRNIVLNGSMVLEGPLNEVMQLPNVRMVLDVAWGTYMVMKAPLQPLNRSVTMLPAMPTQQTFLMAKMSFGNQAVRENLGDVRGFGDQGLTLAEDIGIRIFSGLKLRLLKL